MPQSILFNTIFATAGRVANVALGLLAIKLLTHFLGPSLYGSYALLISFGTILQLVADFGLYLHLTRIIAAQPARQSEIISTIFSLRLTLLILVFTIGIGLSLLIPALRNLVWPFSLIAIGLAWQSLSQLYMGIFQHRQAVWRAAMGDLIGRLAQIGAVLFFGLRGAVFSGLVASFTIGSGLALIFHHVMLPPLGLRLVFQWSKWKPIITSVWPLGLLLLLNAIYFRIDAVILSFFRPVAEVGWYSLSYRIIESVLFFPAMFGGLLLPRMSEAASQNNVLRLKRFISQGLTLQLVVVGFVLITFLLKAPAIILFIADEAFIPAAPLLQILSLALAVMFFGNIFGFAMIALQKQKILLKLYAALALCNVIGNILAIPFGGSRAAALVTLATEITATAVVAWVIYQTVPYRISIYSVGCTLGAGCLAFAIYAVLPSQWPLLIQLMLAGTGYLSVIVATGSITREQLSLLRSVSIVG